MEKYNLAILSGLVVLLFLNLSPLYGSNESTPTPAAATALLKVCGPGYALSGSIPPICGDANFHVLIDEDCSDLVPVTVYLTNIDDNPEFNVNYNLPAGTRPIHLKYEYSPGNWVVTEELTDVIFKGMANTIPVFGIDINLPTEVTTDIGCPPDIYRIISSDLKVQVVTPNLFTGNGQDYILYPVLDEANSSTGIFSCEIFMETNCYCSGNGVCDPTSPDVQPNYDFELCLECNCEGKGFGSGGSSVNTSEIDANYENDYFELSPNPFSDLLQVKIGAIEDNSKYDIKVFDSMGKVVHREQYNAMKGQNNFKINTSLLAQGVYYFVIDDGTHSKTEKMILMKQ